MGADKLLAYDLRDKIKARVDIDQLVAASVGGNSKSFDWYNPGRTYNIGDVVPYITAGGQIAMLYCKEDLTTGEFDITKWAPFNILDQIRPMDCYVAPNQAFYPGIDLSVKFADEIAQIDISDVETEMKDTVDAEDAATKYCTKAMTLAQIRSWRWMKKRIDEHNYYGFRIGDYLPLTVKDELHDMQIAGMDTHYASGYPEEHGQWTAVNCAPVPFHIDFISRHLLNDKVMWNINGTNCGTGDGTQDDGTDVPYLSSTVYNYLTGGPTEAETEVEKWKHDTTTEKCKPIIHTINKHIRDLLFPKVQLLERRAKLADGDPLTDSTQYHWYNMGKLWLPTEYEVYGAIVWGSRWSIGTCARYPLFRDNSAVKWIWSADNKHDLDHDITNVKVTDLQSGGRGLWWLACATAGWSNSACNVNHTGYAYHHSVVHENIRVPVALRIAATEA